MFQHAMWVACEHGLLDFVECIYSLEPKPAQLCMYDALRIAVKNDHIHILEWACTKCFEHDLLPAMNTAASKNKVEIVKLLYEHGVVIGAAPISNPLYCAVDGSSVDVVQYLISTGNSKYEPTPNMMMRAIERAAESIQFNENNTNSPAMKILKILLDIGGVPDPYAFGKHIYDNSAPVYLLLAEYNYKLAWSLDKEDYWLARDDYDEY